MFAELIQQIDSEQASIAFARSIAATFATRTQAATVVAESALLAGLKTQWPAEHRARVREAAAATDEHLTLRFLVPGDEHRLVETQENDIPLPDYGERPLTLGERKSLARRPSREIIERALLDPDASVATNLLFNPKLTEDDVMRMAARRPGPPSVLAAIALHPRWRRRRRVILALVYNSYLPTWYGLSLLPWLDSREAAEVAADARLDTEIRQATEDLLKNKVG
ncbi:MAG: hypothetical protein JRF63_06100 [Deltaproteobacteria bacterium]|nr:hypothetical protein [Deltaproteobacteria bacterium]